MKVNVDKKKLNRLFKLIFFVFVVVLILAFYVLPKSEKGELIPNNEEGVSTDVVFEASQYEKTKMVQDYLNPTDAEKNAINATYGIGNWYFDNQGLHVTLQYIEDNERLYTDVWPENEKTKNILKPEMEILEIELGKTFMQIKVTDVTEKDVKRYIKDIKKEYKEEMTPISLNEIFRASTEDHRVVNIEYKENSDEALIRYTF